MSNFSARKKTEQLIRKHLPTKSSDVGENVLIQRTKKSYTKYKISTRICKKRKNSMFKVHEYIRRYIHT